MADSFSTYRSPNAPDAPDQGAIQQHWGKYRGRVVENEDPEGIARILVDVPQFPNMISAWAMPCTPYAGPDVGFYAIPPIGANVWVEFEGGNINRPIWSGCFWGNALEMPGHPALPTNKIFKTEMCTLTLSDIPGEGATLTVLPNSMQINQELLTVRIEEAVLTLIPEALTLGIEPTNLTIGNEGMILETPTVSITATVNITGDVAIEGAVQITGNTTIDGAVEISGATDMNGLVTIFGEGTTITSAAIAISGGEVNLAAAAAFTIECADVDVLGTLNAVAVDSPSCNVAEI